MHRIISFMKREVVLSCATLLALASMIVVPVDKAYRSYIDVRVLVTLFCLMLVIQAFIKYGLFSELSHRALSWVKSTKVLALVLVSLVFFCSMFVTNDVALLTFVPLTMLLLSSFEERPVMFIVIMETIAANLGSMALPFGNPQNLYLYSYYRMGFLSFFRCVAPVALVGYILILACLSFAHLAVPFSENNQDREPIVKGKLVLSLVVFILCILSVVRLVNYWISFFVVLGVFLWLDRSLFAKVDYSLLMTFVAFFVFVGNVGRVPSVSRFLQDSIQGHEFMFALLSSQVISNVPAAILLSHFTNDGRALLLGTDIGGLGTLVASLASLISFKVYCRARKACKLRYLLWFSLYNVLFLIVLVLFVMLCP
ncbi:MAG: SLC13 family permease [Sphaerochaetaceae bacterium]